MSRKTKKKRDTAAPPASPRRPLLRRGSTILAACLLLLGAAFAATRYEPMRRAVGLRSLTAPAAEPQQTQLQLAKEYVYAGGRLVATEEQGVGGPTLSYVQTSVAGSTTSGHLSWTDNADNEAGFLIEAQRLHQVVELNSGWYEFGQVGPNVTTYNVSASFPGYNFRVRAIIPSGFSGYSNVVYVSGPSCFRDAQKREICFSSSGLTLAARAVAPSRVLLVWSPAPGAVDRYEVERRQSLGEQFAQISTSTGTSLADYGASPDTAYQYRVRAVFPDGSRSDYSNSDLATTVIFTDDPLQTGLVVKAAHLNELRRAVSAVHALAGLGAVSAWTYPNPVSSPPEQRRAIHWEDVQNLRDRLGEALPALGIGPPDYVDQTLTQGTAVRKEHFQQLREAVR